MIYTSRDTEHPIRNRNIRLTELGTLVYEYLIDGDQRIWPQNLREVEERNLTELWNLMTQLYIADTAIINDTEFCVLGRYCDLIENYLAEICGRIPYFMLSDHNVPDEVLFNLTLEHGLIEVFG